jgi:superoxide dismutase, Fe-Mn family
MNFEAKNFDNLLGAKGLSENLLNNHFGLYAGYVANTNKLSEEIEKHRKEGEMASPQYAEMKRRFGWEFDGMRLHELYFEGLSMSPVEIDGGSDLSKKMDENFGSFSEWQKDFRATLAMRGIGWAVLYFDRMSGKLINAWIGEHDGGHLAAAFPILVIDAFEHAYMLDYGTKKTGYIDAVMKMINWKKIEERFVAAKE